MRYAERRTTAREGRSQRPQGRSERAVAARRADVRFRMAVQWGRAAGPDAARVPRGRRAEVVDRAGGAL